MIPEISTEYRNTLTIRYKHQTFYYSYNTCIGYSDKNYKIRLSHFISRTTSKHVSKLNISGFDLVEEKTFNKIISDNSK